MPGPESRDEVAARSHPAGQPPVQCLASAMPVVLDRQNAAPNLSSDEIVNTVTQILLTDDKFANELEQWCSERCDRFFLDDESEHLMEHWKLHEDFCNLFVLMRGRK